MGILKNNDCNRKLGDQGTVGADPPAWPAGRRVRPLRKQAGFTLLEVMVAMAILAVTLVTVGSLRNRDIVYHREIRQIITGTLLAQERMTTLEIEDEVPAYGENSGGFEAPYEGFRWVQIVTPTLLDIAREVRLQIRWGEKPQDMVELVSYVLEEDKQ